LRVIVTVSLVGGQVPLLIVQTNLLMPYGMSDSAEFGLFGEAIVAFPKITVHVPVPMTGVLPARVAFEEQMVWSGPALAAVGG